MSKKKHKGPKVLLLDIETAPILAYCWGIWQQNIGLNQIKVDSYVLSWSAKWEHEPASKIMYADQRFAENTENDSKILGVLWKLLDKADVVVTHNGKKFDIPRLNARFVKHGFHPPSSFKQIDTLSIAKKRFAFTSNRLEHLADKLCKRKKSKHRKFDGFTLWTECLAGNREAWHEMEKYNKQDVLVLEEVYRKLLPWDAGGVNFSLYTEGYSHVCGCGSTAFKRYGFAYTGSGKFQRWQCKKCGAETRDKINLLTPEKRSLLHTGVSR